MSRARKESTPLHRSENDEGLKLKPLQKLTQGLGLRV